ADCGGEKVAKVRGATQSSAPSRQKIVQQHTVGRSGRGFEVSNEGCLQFASCGCCRCATARIRGRLSPRRDAGVGGKPFANLVAPFVFRRAGKPAPALEPESQ